MVMLCEEGLAATLPRDTDALEITSYAVAAQECLTARGQVVSAICESRLEDLEALLDKEPGRWQVMQSTPIIRC